jgi:formylglycine-generating enzyme required for sulfatase activity
MSRITPTVASTLRTCAADGRWFALCEPGSEVAVVRFRGFGLMRTCSRICTATLVNLMVLAAGEAASAGSRPQNSVLILPTNLSALEIGHSTVQNSPAVTGEMTVEYWIRYTSGNHGRPVSKRGCSYAGYTYWITPQREVGVEFGTGVSLLAWTGGVLPSSSWHHVAVVWRHPARTLQCFIDGELVRVDTDIPDAAPGVAENSLRFGNQCDRGMVGAIDNVRLWSVARTPEQIRDTRFVQFDQVMAADAPGLIGSWSFDGPLPLSDAAGNSPAGILRGGSHLASDPSSPLEDSDFDGIPDGQDNCPMLGNPSQADCDSDGVGDACAIADGAADADGNGIPDCCDSGVSCGIADYPVQWRTEDGGNGHWYQVFAYPDRISWLASKQAAEAKGGYLVTITSDAESLFLSQAYCGLASLNVPGYRGPWIGLRYVSGEWIWITGEKAGYTAWAPHQPDLLDFQHVAGWGPCEQTWGNELGDDPYNPVWLVVEWSADCNGDGVVDYGQILRGELVDADASGVPDICETPPCPADVVRDGMVDAADLALVLSQWGTSGGTPSGDVTGDGTVEGKDLAIVISAWGPCTGAPLWATVIEAHPDPTVVTDSNLRAAILSTGYAWRVRDADTQIEMVLIPPGTFDMGCSVSIQSECDSLREIPVHSVTLTRPFYMGRFEVTQAQWAAQTGSNPSWFQESNGFSDSATRPVERVSWNMASTFAAAVSMRLPTEAEWEYACRAGTTTAYHGFAGQQTGSDDEAALGGIAWFVGNSGGQTHPVGLKAANGFGLYDMSGNALEWVNDWFEGNYYASSPPVDPPGPASSSHKTVRGGNYETTAVGSRSSARNFGSPAMIPQAGGLRVARDP